MTEPQRERLEESNSQSAGNSAIHILQVDDELSFLKVSKQILEMGNPFEVDVAGSVEEAKEKMKKKTYDVIVCDYLMPGKDGLQFLKELRAKGNGIPFIIFTGKGMEEVAVKALNLGADHYLSKTTDSAIMFQELSHDIREAVEKKRAYLSAWIREEKLRAILDSSPDAIIMTDMHATVIECNPETLRLTGFSSKEELVGINMLDLFVETDREKILESLRRTLKEGITKDVVYNFSTKCGGESVEVSANVLRDSSGSPTGFVTIIRDITQRKRMENKLKRYSNRLEESKKFLENVFAASPDAITVADLNGNIIECNQAALGVHKCSSRYELIGENLLALVAKHDHRRVEENLKKIVEIGAIKNMEYVLLKKDGREFPAEISGGIIKDSSGNSLGFVIITKDVTDRKNLQKRLVVHEKMAAIGQLAAAVSHDIRNPLSVIKNSTYFLQMRLKGSTDEKVEKHLAILEKEINYTNLIISDLLDFAKKKPLDLRKTDLNQLLGSALSSVSKTENVRVVTKFGKIRPILLDSEQMRRVFMNIILNGFQAMPDGGELVIQTSKHDGLIETVFKDTGAGISEENMQKLFTPFFSTKRAGVGLGLSICKQIVEDHGGNITVESEENQGSTFTIKLPNQGKGVNKESPSIVAFEVNSVESSMCQV